MSWSGRISEGASSGEDRRSDILKLILYDLNSAIAPTEHRLLALQTAIAEFDHDEDWKHDEELDLHADKILFQKLAFCFISDPSSEEVAMICTALEMVYRASRQRIALSFSELRESVLPIFVTMLNRPLRFRKLEQLEEAKLEASQKRLSQDEEAEQSTVHDQNEQTGGKNLQDSFAVNDDDYPKKSTYSRADDPTHAPYADDHPKEGQFVDEQTYATYADDYPKKTKYIDEDDQTYATYADDYPKKGNATYAGDQSYATYTDDYPKKETVMGEDDQTYATYEDDYPKKEKYIDEDDQTYATYADDYPKKGTVIDEDNQTYATYEDDYPKKGTVIDEDNQTYATYEDDYPKKEKVIDEDDQTYTTHADDYPRKEKVIDEDDQTYTTHADDYPRKEKVIDEDDQTYDDDYPQKAKTNDVEINSYGTYDENSAQKTEFIDESSNSYVTHEQDYPKKGNKAFDDDQSYNTIESCLIKAAVSAYSDTGSREEGRNSIVSYDHGDASYSQRSHDLGKGDTYTQGDTYTHGETDKSGYFNQSNVSKGDGTQYKYGGDATIHTHDEYEVETVMSDDTDGNSVVKPKTGDRRYEPSRDDATRYNREGLETIAEGEFDTIGEGSNPSGTEYAAADESEQQLSSRSAYASQAHVKDAQSIKTVSTHAISLKEKKRQQEQGAVTVTVQRLESQLKLIRFDVAANPIAVGRSLQVLRYFSRVLSAMVQLAHHPGMLDALVYQLERQPYGRYQQHFKEYENGEQRTEGEMEELHAARIDAIATIVNLACAEENKILIANHKGLLDAINDVAQNDESEEAREHAAIVIMNLAYEDENKVLMVRHRGMLKTLSKLLQDKSPFTRRYASAALFTLACVVGNTERMASFCDGEILECLRRVLQDDPVDEARINSAEALFNMARNNTEATVQMMGDHPRLLATLAKSILTDYSADVRVYCARALEWMSADVHDPMDCHRTLLSALTVSAQWTKTNCIAEAFKTQATLSENRFPMAAHDGLLQALSNLALLESLSDADVRKSAIAALEMISREPAARKYMVHNEQVMRSLTKASFETRGDGDNDDFLENEEEGTVTGKMIKNALKNLADDM